MALRLFRGAGGARAGNASMETTMRYAHLSPAAMRDAVSKLDEPAPAFGGAQAGHMESRSRTTG
jgi:hypothetical protein